MKEALETQVLRSLMYKWSKIQFSSENMKFFAACDNLLSRLPSIDVEQRAESLKKITKEFIHDSGDNAVNISGSQRRRFLSQVKACKNDEELAALLPDILSEPLNEVMRVMEYDLYPGFADLVKEVIAIKKEEQRKSEERKITSVVMMLDNQPLMQELLVYLSDFKQQNLVIFINLVSQFRIKGCATSNFPQFSPYFIFFNLKGISFREAIWDLTSFVHFWTIIRIPTFVTQFPKRR